MRILSVLKKSIREQLRDYWILILTVITAPFFVFLYWMMTFGGSTFFNVLIYNADKGITAKNNSIIQYSDSLISEFKKVTYNDGRPILNIILEENKETAEKRLKNREAAALVCLPVNFSQIVKNNLDSLCPSIKDIIIEGDLTNPAYPVASIMVNVGLMNMSEKYLKFIPPLNLHEIALGQSSTRTEFENYVPGLFVLALIMLVYSVAMPIAREHESLAIRRLKITNMTSLDYMGGLSIVQILIAFISVVGTILTAMAFGFRSEGPLLLGVLVITITSLSFIGVGLIVACFSKNATEALVIGTFPMFLLMFFTGAAFPIGKFTLFTIFNKSVGAADFLAPTHAVTALNKIFTMGAGFSDILYELSAMLITSLFYYAIGIWLFQKMRLNIK